MATGAYIYTMRNGKNRGTTAGTKYDAELVPFNNPVATSRAASFRYAPDSRIDRRFGSANFPYAAGDTNDPAAGMQFGIGFTNWFLDTLDANKTVRMAIVQQNSASDISTGFHLSPVIQTGHTTGQIIMRVRYDNASGGQLNTIAGQYTGSAGNPTADVTGTASKLYSTTDADIATNSGNMTEWYIQYTPSDSAISTTNKHNLYVAVRTVGPTGTSVFGITLFTHFATSTGGANPRMPISDKTFALGRNVQTNVTGGMIGDYLAFYADAGTDSSVVTNTTTIGTTLTNLWASLDLLDRDGFIRNRGRSRGRA